MVILA